MTKAQITKRLATLRNTISIAASEWQELLDEMQEHFDDKSEAWQTGEKGDEYQDYIQAVEEQIDTLNEIADFGLGFRDRRRRREIQALRRQKTGPLAR